MSSMLRSPLLLGILAIGLAACADSPTSPSSVTSSTLAPTEPSFDRPAPQHSVAKYEVYFMEFTIDHHLGGVAMAKLCLARAVHRELTTMCAEELAAQSAQIEQLRTWLRSWYGIEYRGEIPPSARKDIRKLSQFSGSAFEDEFLDIFSMHHVMIIKESDKAARTVYHDGLRGLAQMIVTKQSAGVIMMRKWDCRWYGDCSEGLTKQAEKRS